ncbi:DNA primase [Adhaeretor mobilis]|nr:DNA primase [Adhaeretor mobilis]
MSEPTIAHYGFRIVGDCRSERRLVEWPVAFAAYCRCDGLAEVEREAYLSAFTFGDAFREHLTNTGSTKGYSGPSWSPWLWFDIDAADDIPAAHNAARSLCAVLIKRYKLDDNALLIFFSGSKGFHVGLPTALFTPGASATYHRIARQFAEHVAALARIDIDTGVYDAVRAFRAPNSRHPKTGLHKRRFEFDELLHLKTTRLVELAATPEPFDVPTKPVALNQTAASDWQQADHHVAKQRAAMRERRQAVGSGATDATLNRATLEFLRQGATKGDRHRLLFSAAANLAEFRCSAALAHALLTESALDSGLSPSEVRRQIDCGLNRASLEGGSHDR